MAKIPMVKELMFMNRSERQRSKCPINIRQKYVISVVIK